MKMKNEHVAKIKNDKVSRCEAKNLENCPPSKSGVALNYLFHFFPLASAAIAACVWLGISGQFFRFFRVSLISVATAAFTAASGELTGGNSSTVTKRSPWSCGPSG